MRCNADGSLAALAAEAGEADALGVASLRTVPSVLAQAADAFILEHFKH